MKIAQNIKPIEIDLRENSKIAIVTAEFNQEITKGLHEGAKDFLIQSGLTDKQIKEFWVSGAVEIPLVLKALAKKGYQGIIALGCVIKGETAHFDYVCKFVTEGVLKVGLEEETPISFGVLTTNTLSEAQDRSRFPSEENKGAEAASALLKQILTLREIYQTR